MATIEKRANGYRITVSCGYDVFGKQIRPSMTWIPDPGMTSKKIEKELNRQAVIFEEKCKAGLFIDGSTKFVTFADQWIDDYAKKNLRATTVRGYRDMLIRINAAIGHIKLSKLQPRHLMAFYDNLSEAGMRKDAKRCCTTDFTKLLCDKAISKTALATKSKVSISVVNSIADGKNISFTSAEKISQALELKEKDLFVPVDTKGTLSQKTILNHHALISSILSTAVEWQAIIANPCDRVKSPKVKYKEVASLDDRQAQQLLSLITDAPLQYQTIIYLLMYTGLRRGELCGLEWKDINFESKLINVRRSSLYLSEKGIFEDDTKTTSSERIIKTTDDVLNILKTHKNWQAKEKEYYGEKWTISDRIFTGTTGKPIHPDTVTGWFHKFIEKNDLPPISIHGLRHTNATLLIAGGMDVATVAKRLGHKNSTVTQKIYIHAIKSADEAASEMIADMLSPTKRHNIKKLPRKIRINTK